MTRKQEWEWIKNYISDITLKHSPAGSHQLRALWTAFCLHQDLDPDTNAYDNYLLELFQYIDQAEDRMHKACCGQGFDEFNLFMGELLC